MFFCFRGRDSHERASSNKSWKIQNIISVNVLAINLYMAKMCADSTQNQWPMTNIKLFSILLLYSMSHSFIVTNCKRHLLSWHLSAGECLHAYVREGDIHWFESQCKLFYRIIASEFFWLRSLCLVLSIDLKKVAPTSKIIPQVWILNFDERSFRSARCWGQEKVKMLTLRTYQMSVVFFS